MTGNRIAVIRRARFSAAHFFWLPELSEAENRERFGPTAHRNGHGHNYELEMTVSGPCDPATGMVVNLKDLKTILDEEVLQPLDFKNLALDVPFFEDRLPTLENLVLYLWPKLAARIQALSLRLDKLRVYELEDLYVEYDGTLAP